MFHMGSHDVYEDVMVVSRDEREQGPMGAMWVHMTCIWHSVVGCQGEGEQGPM